jgi:hypothetical protein
MNEENLIPFSERSKEEARTLGRKGGINSGKSRRQRKTLKEELLLLLAEGDTQKNISVALIQQALEGNTKAFEVIRDSIGEKQIEQTELINKEINVVIK